MALTNIVRNLRDGELKIEDGTGTPEDLTLALDNGDLSWSETENDVQVLDRGVLDHPRDGDEAAVELSFSFMWTQLINATRSGGSAGSANTLYEMINDLGTTYISVGASGEKFQLKYTFEVSDPSTGSNNERIVFGKVYKQSLECSEGDEANTVNFTGTDFETKPTITRF